MPWYTLRHNTARASLPSTAGRTRCGGQAVQMRRWPIEGHRRGHSPEAGGGAAASNLPVMQSDEIFWNGQPVAVVVAKTQEQAEYAASLVMVTYQFEPAALSFDALKPSAAQPPEMLGEPAELKISDAEAGLREAAFAVDQVYRTARNNGDVKRQRRADCVRPDAEPWFVQKHARRRVQSCAGEGACERTLLVCGRKRPCSDGGPRDGHGNGNCADPARGGSAGPACRRKSLASAPIFSRRAVCARAYSTRLGRYWTASARCAAPMPSCPARSAIVRANFSTRW